MIPIWIKNKKTGRYDKIPYDAMLKSAYPYKGKPIWYLSTSQTCREHDRIVNSHPKYFLNVGLFMYAFTGRKWGLHHRLINWFVCSNGPRRPVIVVAVLGSTAFVGGMGALVAFGVLIVKAFK